MSFKIVFMGTPDFAVPSLRMLIEDGYHVAACFTQPDRKAGRGHRLVPPPVKVLAEKHGIPVYQFERVSAPEGVEVLKKLAPDVMVTAAFGHILSDEVLAIPKYGCINVHASLLPKLRGAAPIQWAVINGDSETGVTTMYTVKKLDAGDILEQDRVPIPDDMTAGELYDILSEIGAKTLRRTLEKLEQGTMERTLQNEAEATYFPMFKKGFGEIDFAKSRRDIINFVRGTNPFPGAYVMYNGEKIRVYEASASDEPGTGQTGEIVQAGDKCGLLVQAGDGVVSLDMIKRPNSRAMSARACFCGSAMDEGYVFARPGGGE